MRYSDKARTEAERQVEIGNYDLASQYYSAAADYAYAEGIDPAADDYAARYYALTDSDGTTISAY